MRRSASPPQPIRGREEEVGASSRFPESGGNSTGSGGNRLVSTQEFKLGIIDCDNQIHPWPSAVPPVLYSYLPTARARAGLDHS